MTLGIQLMCLLIFSHDYVQQCYEVHAYVTWWSKLTIVYTNDTWHQHAQEYLPLVFQNVNTSKSLPITLFRSIRVFSGIDRILQNIPHIQIEYGEYYAKQCQSHGTLLWILIMLRSLHIRTHDYHLTNPNVLL